MVASAQTDGCGHDAWESDGRLPARILRDGVAFVLLLGVATCRLLLCTGAFGFVRWMLWLARR